MNIWLKDVKMMLNDVKDLDQIGLLTRKTYG